ncbi:MAG TPA: class I SAM-dependent methyltransferase [Chitinophagales bacterium]|nr:class I SAM-dependent methyltransferase [Chitinophagales bacterium]
MKEFLSYLLRGRSIHAIHSSFVFGFMQNVMLDRRTFYCYEEIEMLRNELLQSNELIDVTDLGAGSYASTSSQRKIKTIAKNSATPRKLAQLLFRIGNYFDCRRIVEVGTSLGLTSLYFSSISKEAKVITVEGDSQLAALAMKNFQSLERKNIELLQGSFEEKLPEALSQLTLIDLGYLDGNHRKEATLSYFNSMLPFTHEKTILIIGDIHWSPEMKGAWNEITSQPQVTLTLDLFYVGIIFFRTELLKQNFVLRFL